MKRKKIFLILMSAVFLTTVSACYDNAKEVTNTEIQEMSGTLAAEDSEQTGKSEVSIEIQESSGTPAAEDSEQAEKDLQEELADAEEKAAKAYKLILESGSTEFVGDYLLTEEFLDWLAEQYGQEMIFQIAEALEISTPQKEQWYAWTENSLHVLWNRYGQDTGVVEEVSERIHWKECASEEKIVLDFIGDINFDENWSTMQHLDSQLEGLYDCLSPNLLKELHSADIMMVNNEFTYSTGGTPIPGKSYTFRANPSRVSLLEGMGADIVSLANNHAYDYGEEALIDTLETLEGAGIPYVGAGRNLSEAMEPVYFIANGRKIAIVSATQIERSYNYTKEATETSAGVLKTLNPDKFVTVIENADKKADYVIVYVHWGTENTAYFAGDQTALADAFIEAGADAIIGGHTHCLQGCEYRQGVPIIYSLGNFWFNKRRLDSGISQLVIQKDGSMEFRFLPCVQVGNEAYLEEDAGEKQRILNYMEAISSGVTIDEEGYIRGS